MAGNHADEKAIRRMIDNRYAALGRGDPAGGALFHAKLTMSENR